MQQGNAFNSNNNNDPREYYLKKFGYLRMWTRENFQEYLNSDGDYRGIASKFQLDGLKLAEMTEPQFLVYADNNNWGSNLFNSLQYFKEKDNLERPKKRIKVRAMDADPEWSNPQPIQCPDFTQKIVKISHLIACGLSREVDFDHFFVRNEWKTMLNTLSNPWKRESSPTIKCKLVGPPGTGSSSMVWGWCCWNSIKNKKKIIWLKFKPKEEGGIQEVYLDGSTVCHRVWANASSFPWELLRKSDVIVVDGYTKDSQVGLPSDTPVIYVSSMRVPHNTEADVLLNPMHLWSLGWTLEEYLQACDEKVFFDSVQSKLDAPLLKYEADEDFSAEQNSVLTKTVEEKKAKFAPNRSVEEIIRILAKHYFAGGSARWMFNLSTDTVKNTVDDAIFKINDWKVFADCAIGTGSLDENVNILCTAMPSLPGSSTPTSNLVSEFVTEKLRSKADAAFIRTVTARSRHPFLTSFDGWVLRLDFLMHLHAGATVKLVEKSSDPPNEVNLMVSVDPIEFIVAEELAKESSVTILRDSKFKNFWFIPTKENQPCFDALQIHTYGSKKKKTKVYLLRIIQITRAKTHSISIGYVQPVFDVLNSIGFPVNKVELVAVIPDYQKEFKFDPWEGGKKSFRDQLRKMCSETILRFKRANH